MTRFLLFTILLISYFITLPMELLAQGETTSAIVGQVNDPTGAAIPRRHRDDHESGDRSEAHRQNR